MHVTGPSFRLHTRTPMQVSLLQSLIHFHMRYRAACTAKHWETRWNIVSSIFKVHSAFREFHDSDVGKTVIVPLRYANTVWHLFMSKVTACRLVRLLVSIFFLQTKHQSTICYLWECSEYFHGVAKNSPIKMLTRIQLKSTKKLIITTNKWEEPRKLSSSVYFYKQPNGFCWLHLFIHYKRISCWK